MRFGYSRDAKRGKTQVVYGVFAGDGGCPVAVSVYPLLADRRAGKRGDLLAATEKQLDKVVRQLEQRRKTPLTAAEIGQKVGRIKGRFKVAKHFRLVIADGALRYQRDTHAIAAEARLDGLYGSRTSEPRDSLSPEDAVRAYKDLGQVEPAFRCLKGLDIRVRPIRHRHEDRVRAHIFLCLLADYLEWHLRKALAPLLFDDETREADRKTRDPVAPAKPSPAARRKKSHRQTDDGVPVHSFETLLAELGTRCRHRCRLNADPKAPTVETVTKPTPIQGRVLELIEAFPVPGTAHA